VKEISATRIPANIDWMIQLLRGVREGGGRLFIPDMAGSAGNADAPSTDFGKSKAYAAPYNVSELTARLNDDGWDSRSVNWLKGSHCAPGGVFPLNESNRF